MIDLLNDNRTAVTEMCERQGVSRLEVFGSAARGDFDPDSSDLDFVIEFVEYGLGISKRYIGFVRAMEAHFGRKIDIVVGPTMKNPIFQEEVDLSRKLIYESPGRIIAA